MNNYKNRRNLVKKRLREQGKLFFQNSSLHGVKYVAENERSFVERLVNKFTLDSTIVI